MKLPPFADVGRPRSLTNVHLLPSGRSDGGDNGIGFVSPFAIETEGDWIFAGSLSDVPEGGMLPTTLGGESVMLSRRGAIVTCFQNACAHPGMPIDDGRVEDGIITCPHHGFQYDLATGECLTAPSVQLQLHAVRVLGRHIEVRLAR